MTTTLHPDGTVAEITPPSTDYLVREFDGVVRAGDGRTVDVRIVPFGEKIIHSDGFGPVTRGVPYEEEWLPGVFDHQLKAADKVVGNYEHIQGPAGLVARAISLESRHDGYHATFRMLDGSDADKTLELIRAGVLDGASIEARPVKDIRTERGVQRARADLRAVAFTRFAAYEGARVLAVRESATFVIDEDLVPVDFDPELVARWRRLGIKLPPRYEAHPDDTGTPADAGTPGSGTRPTDNHTTSEGEHNGVNPS